MKNLIAIVLTLLLMSSCSPKPKPIEYGADACHYCKMTIVDRQHAAELVTTKGKVFKFDAIECMINYYQPEGEEAFALFLVNDYQTPGKLIDAKESFYLISEAIPSPMGAFLTAFEEEAAARKMQEAKGGRVFNWKNLQQHAGEKGLTSYGR